MRKSLIALVRIEKYHKISIWVNMRSLYFGFENPLLIKKEPLVRQIHRNQFQWNIFSKDLIFFFLFADLKSSLSVVSLSYTTQPTLITSVYVYRNVSTDFVYI